MTATRELFTVATPAHQGQGSSFQRQSVQDSQTLPGLPPQTSPSLYTSQQQPNPSFSPGAFPTPSYPSNVPQNSYAPPASPLEKSSPPPPSSPIPEHASMQQGNFDPYYNSNVTVPAPAYGYPAQSPQPYGQPQPPMQPMPSAPAMQTMQPAPAPGMDIRNVKGLPRDGNGEREWSHGCSECCDACGSCMLGWCCPCMLYSQIQTRFNHLESRGTPHPEGGDSFTGDCFIHCLLTSCIGAGWVLQIGQRGSIRQRYRIRGDGCGDCMMSWCCSPCQLTQASRELELEERSFVGVAAIQQPPMPIQAPSAYPEKR